MAPFPLGRTQPRPRRLGLSGAP